MSGIRILSIFRKKYFYLHFNVVGVPWSDLCTSKGKEKLIDDLMNTQ